MDEEWGPWIEHKIIGCPVEIGQYIQTTVTRYATTLTNENFVDDDCRAMPWWYDLAGWKCVYRIRRPKAVERLRDIAANPEREVEHV